MNTCKYCGKPLTLTPEFDTCMECQGRIMREATMPQNSFTTNSTKSSMNIYDEALKEYKCSYVEPCNDPNLVIRALKRAKKVEELLKLYKTLYYEIMTIPNVYNNVMHGDNDIWYRIKPKIENREKELEELK